MLIIFTKGVIFIYLLETMNIHNPYSLKAMKMGTEIFKLISYKEYVPFPGWNIYCKDKCSIAREAFLKWVWREN